MSLSQYLERYAEPESKSFTIESQHLAADYCLVVPIYNEAIDHLDSILSSLKQFESSVLVILVFNAPNNAKEPAVAETLKTLKWARQQASWGSVTPILVDRVTDNRIPYKQGVGLARKIGMDIALKVHAAKSGKSRGFQWLHMTDADVMLPPTYFSCVDQYNSGDYSALIYPFYHRSEPGLELEMALYDLSLRYYVGMLAWAGSPFAYYTIGSVLAIAPESYAQARGMPKRAAAEDFYLLNKISKLKPVMNLREPTIEVSGRPSDRVPFGTGPGIQKISVMGNPLSEYLYYHPLVFKGLKIILDITIRRNSPPNSSEFDAQLKAHSIAGDETILERASEVVELKVLIKSLEPHRKSRAKWHQHFHEQFDGFKTLKFIHTMRDLGLNSIPIEALRMCEDGLPQSVRESIRHTFKHIEEK